MAIAIGELAALYMVIVLGHRFAPDCPRINFDMMESIRLTISDETLRDGEQQVGINFSAETKRELAQLIAQTGVPQIAMMPAIHPSEEELVRSLTQTAIGPRIAASTMMTRSFIEQSQACGVEQIILFHAVSDRLLFIRDAEIRSDPVYGQQAFDETIPAGVIDSIRHRMLTKVVEHLRYAKQLGLTVYFAAEDASRAEFDLLVDCIRKFQPYVEHFLLCDTVGILTPEASYRWLRNLLDCVPQAAIAVHFHNDLGLALENTIQAILAGAIGVSGTFGGIGERAGNVALEQVLNGLKLRFGWQVEGIDYEALERVTTWLEEVGARANAPYSPASQRHETGIHAHSMLRDRHSYCTFPYAEPEIWFGKYSGTSN
ncbi:MAG TPA: 2-isopropylmalate synthase, partial [Chroococcidiopsis sp.]